VKQQFGNKEECLSCRRLTIFSLFVCFTIEPSRYAKDDVRDTQVFKCHHLANELKLRNMHRIDYMTIDTEGSEPDIVKDFPWNDFDVRNAQIEQLMASQYLAQVGKKEAMIVHLESFGYRLLSEFPVGGGKTTQDLILTRNLDSVLKMTAPSEKPSRIWPHEPKEPVSAGEVKYIRTVR
jgi:hypothetical protein